MFFIYLALLGRILLLGYEKIIVKKLSMGVRSESSAFLYFFIATISLIPVLFFVNRPDNIDFLFPLAISSTLYGIAYLFYVHALSIGEASQVAPLYNLSLFFLLLFTTIFLGERISFTKVIGIALLVLGASLLGEGEDLLTSIKNLTKDRASLFMIFASFFIAAGRTIDGYAIKGITPLLYAFGINLGISIFLFMYMLFTKSVKKMVVLFKERPHLAIGAGCINSYSYLLLLFAFTRIDVSIAEPLSMLSIIVTVILAYFIFGENIRKRIVASLIMVGGTWLLFL